MRLHAAWWLLWCGLLPLLLFGQRQTWPDDAKEIDSAALLQQPVALTQTLGLGDQQAALPGAQPALFGTSAALTSTRRLPPIERFAKLWEARYHSEKRLWEPMSTSIRLVLGIFTQSFEARYRDIVRRTWWNQTGVCIWRGELSPIANCSVYVVFVIGLGRGTILPHGENLSEGAAAWEEDGMFMVQTKEDMNKGKTFSWFEAANKKFPWATHIAKGDIDMYPYVHKLISRMERRRSCVGDYEYAGRPFLCVQNCGRRKPGALEEHFNSSCKLQGKLGCELEYTSDEDLRDHIAKPGSPFTYMGGQFYILSQRLLEKLLEPGQWWRSHRRGVEDYVTAKAIQATASKEHFCVHTWRPDSWSHQSILVSTHYANIF